MESPTTFNLSGRSLRLDTAEDIEPHLKPLIASDNVTEIHLGGNTLGAPACETLASVLRTKTTLQTVKFDDIFTSRLLSEIPPALSSLLTALLELPNLHTVDLADNAFGLNTVAPLVDFLSKHVPLKHLILNNNGLGPDAGILIANALTALAERKAEVRKAGKEVPDLETVICGRNRLENGSMEAWAKAYQAHKNVKTVKMVQNGIRQDGISTLLKDGFKGCGELEVLDLQDNTFTIKGANALSEVVNGWTHLKELGIGDSLLGSRGAVALGTALGKGKNTKLEVLRLQYNEIDAKGVQGLLAAAKAGSLDKLRRVELNGNKFAEDDQEVEGLRILLDERKEEAGGGVGNEEWGLDELSDLEEDDSDEDEDEVEGSEEDDDEKAEEEEKEGRREVVLKDADEEEERKVGQKKDEDVDALAETLEKTEI